MQSVRTARSARSASRRNASRSPAVRYLRSPSAVCRPMPVCRGPGAFEPVDALAAFRADAAALPRPGLGMGAVWSVEACAFAVRRGNALPVELCRATAGSAASSGPDEAAAEEALLGRL